MLKGFHEGRPKNGMPILLLYEDGKDRAINVVLKRDVALDEKLKGKVEEGHYFDLITPYGYRGFYGNISDGGGIEPDIYSVLHEE